LLGRRKIEKELNLNIDDILNKLTQELGEFNDAVQKYRGKYSRNKTDSKEHIQEEAGDVILNLISILKRLEINPDNINEFASDDLEKFKKRINDYK
jgi:NTP pyrophosphatase (non-canonical NTP hydrolase)